MPSGTCQCDAFADHVTFAAGATIKTPTAGGFPLFVWSNGNQDSRPLLRLGSEYGGVYPRLDIRLENTPAARPTVVFATDREGSSATPPHLALQTAADGRVGIGTLQPFDKLSNATENVYDAASPQSGTSNGKGITWDAAAEGYLLGVQNTGAVTNAHGALFRISRTDASNRILTATSGPVGVTSGTVRFVVLGNGQVGIGTAAPAAPLQIGDGATPGNEGRVRFVTRSGDGATTRHWDIGASFSHYGNGGLAIRDVNMPDPAVTVRQDTGNVGIGTKDPEAKLAVSRTAGAGGLDGPVLQLRADGGQNPRLTVDVANVASGTPVYRLVLGGDPGVQPNLGLAVGGGRVGVGTDNPNSTLQVQNLSGAGLLTLRAGDGPEPRLNVDVVNTPLARPTIRLQADSNQSDPALKPHLALAPVAGNVGVGTTDPDAKLAVVNVNGVGLLSLGATQGKAPRLNVGMVNTANDSPTILVRTESEMAQPPDKPRLVLTAGRVGIGTTDDVPDATLGVSNGTGLALLSLLATGTPRPRLTIDYKNSEDVTPRGQFSLVTGNANDQQPDLVLAPFGGNVGIGTGNLAPTEKLHVGGNLRVSGNIAAGNDLTATNNASIVNDLTVGQNVNVASGGLIKVGNTKIADSGGCFYA